MIPALGPKVYQSYRGKGFRVWNHASVGPSESLVVRGQPLYVICSLLEIPPNHRQDEVFAAGDGVTRYVSKLDLSRIS